MHLHNAMVLHTVLLHFPIVLFWTALVYDLLGWVWKLKTYPAGHWIVVIAAVMAIPTVITGLLAADDIPETPTILTHRNLALATLAYGFLHAVFRLTLIVKKKSFNQSLLVLFSLVNVLLISITAEYGGKVAFGRGLFLAPEEKSHRS